MITCLINQVKGVLRGRGYSQGDLHKFRCSVKCEYSKAGLDKVSARGGFRQAPGGQPWDVWIQGPFGC